MFPMPAHLLRSHRFGLHPLMRHMSINQHESGVKHTVDRVFLSSKKNNITTNKQKY